MSRGLLLETPLWLLVLVPAIAWTLWSERGSRALRSGRRARAARGLRLTQLVLLGVALAGLNAWEREDRLTVIFAVDQSHSVGPASQERITRFLATAAERLPDGDRAGVVVFGEQAMIETLPAPMWRSSEILARPGAQATNLEAAVRLSRGLIPLGDEARLVLLTDGVETEGSLEEELLSAGTKLDLVWVPLPASDSPEVLVERVTAPERVGEGQAHRVQAVVRTSHPTDATLRLFRGAVPVAASRVHLEPGQPNVFAFDEVAAPGARALLYRATVETEEDGAAENNRAAALVQVEGPPSVLVLDQDPATLSSLVQILEETEIRVDLGSATALPSDLAGIAAYDAVLLSDIDATRFSAIQLELMQAYVEDLGGGLLMLGGPNSFGPGGYWQTPVEAVLPVHMELKDRSYFPSLGLVLCLDKSGSMAGFAQEAKIEVAKAAAAEVVKLLTPQDELGIVAFDAAAKWVAPLTRLAGEAERAQVLQSVGTVRAGGGTDAYPAMQLAKVALEASDTQIKHVILMTDGQISGRDHEGLARELVESGITISTVGVGTDADVYTLDRIAWAGEGRFYRALDIDLVPRIFLGEAFKVARSWVVEEPFQPVRRGDHPALTGLDAALPSLGGYVAAAEKSGARHLLSTPRGDPLLSLWRTGLGKSVAFTSDAKARWAVRWLGWDGFSRFWSSLVRWSLKRSTSSRLRLAAQVAGGRLTVTADVTDEAGAFLNGARLVGRVVGPDGTTRSLDLVQSAPGRYQAEVAAEAPGAYLAAVVKGSDGPATQAGTVSAVVPYSAEFRTLDQSPEALERLVASGLARVATSADGLFEHHGTGGTVRWPLWPHLLVLATVLMVGEVAARKVSLPARWASSSADPKSSQAARQEAPADGRARRGGRKRAPAREGADSTSPRSAPTLTPEVEGSEPAFEEAAVKPQPDEESDAYTSRLLEAKRRLRRRDC